MLTIIVVDGEHSGNVCGVEKKKTNEPLSEPSGDRC